MATKVIRPDRDKQWKMLYERLVEFERKNGHCKVRFRHEQDRPLGRWVAKQRRNYIYNNIRRDRKELLDAIGFAWNVEKGNKNSDYQWNMQFEKLVEFQRKNGHFIVPKKYEQDKSLGKWVDAQQLLLTYTKKMRGDRKERLDELGLFWKVDIATRQAAKRQADSVAALVSGDDEKWRQQYEKRVDFKRKTGHCVVPSDYEQDKSLSWWIRPQRTHHKQNKMRQDRK
jgi:hypothetical protein